MANEEKPALLKPAPHKKPGYNALRTKEACSLYASAKGGKSLAALSAIEKAIMTMTGADPTLQRLMAEAMKHEGIAYQPEPSAETRAYSKAVREAFKTRCAKPSRS